MKKMTIYVCKDGRRFDKRKDAISYDAYIERCEEIASHFASPNSLHYDSYIQYPIELVNEQRAKFYDMVGEMIPSIAEWANECKEGIRHTSHIDRMLSDYDYPCLNKLNFLFSCFDEKGRLYMTPYCKIENNK